MPTNLLPFADSEIRMRYREPFLTEGLDLKLAVNTPPGVYRGFKLGVSGANLTVQVNGDSAALDHCAVYQAGSGHSLTLRKTGGNFNLDLSAYVSKTVVLAIYAAYALGADTAAEIRAYELSPSDEYTGAAERPELVVLGTVVVPASGTVPAANITHDRRTMSWEQVAPEARTWSPLLRNGSFELSETGATHVRATRFWGAAVSPSAGGTFSPVTTDSNTGVKSLQFSYVSGTPTGVFTQPVNVPVSPGQYLRVQAFVKAQQALTTGSVAMALTWRDTASTVVATTTVSIPVTGIDSSYRKIESTLQVPTSPSGIVALAEVQLVLTSVGFGSAGAAVRFDDLQVYVESQSVTGQFLFYERGRSYDVVQDLVFEDQATWTQDALALRFANGTGLIGERKDQSATSAVQPVLDWRGRQVLGANLLDTEAKALLPRITAGVSVVGGVDFTLMWESVPTGQQGYRLYMSATGALVETINARWDGTLWNKDVTAQPAQKISRLGGTFTFYGRDAGASTWNDASWSATRLDMNHLTPLLTVGMPLTLSGLLTVNALSQLNDHVTLAANKNITLQGTGLYKRPSRIRVYNALSAELVSFYPATYDRNKIDFFSGTAMLFWGESGQTYRLPINLDEGEQLNEVRAYSFNGATDVMNMKLWRMTITVGVNLAGTEVQVGSTQTSSNHTSIIEQLTISGLSEQATASGATGLKSWSVELGNPAFAAGPLCAGIAVFTTVP